MSTAYIELNLGIQKELIETIRRIFTGHFEESNVHPSPLGITYRS